MAQAVAPWSSRGWTSSPAALPAEQENVDQQANDHGRDANHFESLQPAGTQPESPGQASPTADFFGGGSNLRRGVDEAWMTRLTLFGISYDSLGGPARTSKTRLVAEPALAQLRARDGYRACCLLAPAIECRTGQVSSHLRCRSDDCVPPFILSLVGSGPPDSALT